MYYPPQPLKAEIIVGEERISIALDCKPITGEFIEINDREFEIKKIKHICYRRVGSIISMEVVEVVKEEE